MNSATHGIELSRHFLAHEEVKSRFGEDSYLELTTWDFAGQNEYYNNHHYFISTRTVFLVTWKMSLGEEGLKGLEFWFRSLSAHLPIAPERDHSVIVVGTFLDHPSVKRDESSLREKLVRELVEKSGLHSPISYLEVSCVTFENIDFLRETVVEEALSHYYMGERVPESYAAIEKVVRELREDPAMRAFPMVEIDEIARSCKEHTGNQVDRTVTKRALELLSSWGTCIYFSQPEELSKVVILEPRFLTKEVLAQLFRPDIASTFCKNGFISHEHLGQVWGDVREAIRHQLLSRASEPVSPEKLERELESMFLGSAERLMALMEKMEVCFQLYTPKPERFWDRQSLIPGLLSEEVPLRLPSVWPPDVPYGMIQIERILDFNIIPSELVSRLIVRVHSLIAQKLVWRHGVLLHRGLVQGLITVLPAENRFSLILRGPSRKECLDFLREIYQNVLPVSKIYPGLRWREKIRSPHLDQSVLEIEDCMADYKKDPGMRNLVCPITQLPVNPESLLVAAGLIDSVQQGGIYLFFLSFFLSFPSFLTFNPE